MTSSDQTGEFSIALSQGKRYIIVMEDSDTGLKLATVIKSRKKEHLL